MRGVLAVVLGLAIATPASAGFMDGNDLYTACKDGQRWSDGAKIQFGSEQAARCMGYVLGVTDIYRLSGDRAQKCSMDNVTAGQLVDVTLKYLTDHPDQRQRAASLLVAFSINAAFCQ
jgi:hypothetical protein